MRARNLRRRRYRRSARERLLSALPSGLRWRLTVWVAAVMLVSFAVVFLVVYQDTGSQLQSEIDRDISGDTSQLAESLQALRGAGPATINAAAKRYVLAQPYAATSTLQFVLMPGVPTTSNHPEVFGGGRLEAGEAESDQGRENV